MENVDYISTFIEVSPDFARDAATEPRERAGAPTIASATYQLIASAPYAYRSSDVIFTVWADRQGIAADSRSEAWAEFYGRSHACLRSSDLGKRYGWGIHADADGRLAVYPVGSAAYASLAAGVAPDGSSVMVTRAMRSSR